MAPILLKIKGTKLFSPFDEIEDVGDLSTLWRVCTKVKDSLENGSRLENLSWRLWHLHQTLEARGKGKDYRKLSPATTKQLEKTIRRPQFSQPKPMQIKVRLGKSSERAEGSSSARAKHTAPAPPESGHDAAAMNARKRTRSPSDSRSGSAAMAKGTSAASAAHPPSAAGASESASRTDSAADSSQSPPDLPASPTAVPGPGDPARAEQTDASPVTNIAAAAAVVGTGPSHTVAAPTTASEAQPGTSAPGPADEVHASDFMSFGPSSFLSNGFDLDAPQIEITLDDIFSASSADWSQFGFASLANSQALGMAIPEYGGAGGAAAGNGAPGMWNGMPYPGPMPAGAPYNMMGQEPPKEHDGPICHNCGVTSTPLWRRSVDDTLLCNACGLYYKLHRTHRPKSLRTSSARRDGVDDNTPKTVCSNCKTTNTPLWRRDEAGQPLCNACGLYYKLHKENRPIALKSDVIRKRQRHDSATANARKRQSRAAQKQPATESSGSATPVAGLSKDVPRDKARPDPIQIEPAQSHLDNSQLLPTSATIAPRATLSHGSPIPQTAPPVSYSANGTQLLNDPEPNARNSSDGQTYSGYGHDYSYTQRLPGSLSDYRRSNTGPELTTMSSHSTSGSAAADSGLPPHPLQQSATLPVHRYSSLSSSAVPHDNTSSSNGSSSQAIGSINIPTSPPLTGRSDTYFGRGLGFSERQSTESQMHLPPLSSSQSSSRFGSGSGGSGTLHSSMTFQPSSSSGSLHAETHTQARASFHYSAQAADASHGPDRQLPSLAELASASTTHGTDSFRYSRQQQQPQQPYPQLNP
ncbi:hypothetical protein IWW55_001657 [Coemansia sp. RSA 2706]|nr:hypothetical protein IWW55_001657 [Coemansia sp. RSA 2706]